MNGFWDLDRTDEQEWIRRSQIYFAVHQKNSRGKNEKKDNKINLFITTITARVIHDFV